MAKRRNFIDRLPLAPVFALLFGTAVAIVIAAMPQWRFEQAVGATGLGSVLSVAVPPLGLKARLLAVMLGFALVATLVWLAATLVQRLIDGPKPRVDDDADDELDLGAYIDTLPPVDAPRRPIFADRELGAPFMSDEALATAPALPLVLTPPEPVTEPEQELALEAPEVEPEPALVLDAPEETVPVAPEPAVPQMDVDPALEAPLDIAEFDLPPVADAREPISDESSIDTLIRRLEAGMARRAGPPPPNPPAAAANPLSAMRDMMGIAREPEAQNDIGSARALDTLQRLAARRMAG
ncbi:hypothetical protein [Sphingomonas sp. SUN039]|uniref:hypothetical protein n=1 Tax=Sphingomonas sp. SUN039 TaxID=2937787 RepID=UPI002164AE42|nr:hypothetical protein [Sphingomonas sp. SUN039]UVO52741.1 hypothetical protein M0209_00840 [Sphingomonas sp. SUN039]